MCFISLGRDPEALTYAIKRSCEDKAAVVAADEKEAGLRATLNLGHTFGHVSTLQSSCLSSGCLPYVGFNCS